MQLSLCIYSCKVFRLVWVSYFVNHLEISQHFLRLLNKESATDIVRSRTVSVIGQSDVFVLDFISHSMF